MNVEEFLSTMDALRFDTELDNTYPELRGMIQKAYPYLRKIYNMMNEAGLLSESKTKNKNVVKINENTLKQIVSESVKRILKNEF